MPYEDYDCSQLMFNMIGEGSFGAVYKVFYKGTKKEFAIKIINAQNVDSIRYEIQVQYRARHQNVTRIWESFEHDGQYYIVMDLYSSDLQKYLVDLNDNKQKMKPQVILRVFLYLVSALNFLHANDILHRDVKPHNLLIDGQINVFLADFGIARTNMQKEGKTLNIGTIEYMAPELFNDCNYKFEPDVFAAGVVLYQMMYATMPFASHYDQILFNYGRRDPLDPDSTLQQLNYLFKRIFVPYQERITTYDILTQFDAARKAFGLPEPQRAAHSVFATPAQKQKFNPNACDSDMYYTKLHDDMVKQIKLETLNNLIQQMIAFIQQSDNRSFQLPEKKELTQKKWTENASVALKDEDANLILYAKSLKQYLTAEQAKNIRKMAICVQASK